MAGPVPVWEAGRSPESEDNSVQAKEPINQSGLTTPVHRLLFSPVNKKHQYVPLNQPSVIFQCVTATSRTEGQCLSEYLC